MATTTLLCKQCNFENEPERVYCHNCGAKLDRSLLPPEATKREDPVIVQQRVRKMIKPRSGSSFKPIRHLVSSLFIAAALAAIVVIVHRPDGIPSVNPDAVMNAPTITDDMEAALQEPASRTLSYTEEQVNAFLQASIRGKNDSGMGMKFEHAYVQFDEGICRIITQQSLGGFSLYAMTTHAVELGSGALVAPCLGGSFGRMPVSKLIMRYAEAPFNPLWKVLDHDKQLVARMKSITFHKGKVEMVTKPAS